MNAREAIFQQIREAATTQQSTPATIQRDAQALLEDIDQARPALLSPVTTDAFVQRLQQGLVIGSSCEVLSSLDDVPFAAAEFLAKHHHPKSARIAPTQVLQTLDWSDWQTDIDLQQDQQAAITLADYGIAETGSVVIQSGQESPILLHFLPLYLVIVLPKSRILAYMDDYAATVDHTQPPRNSCLMTGASGTTDIEGVLVQGAHGPEFVHILVINDH